MRTLFAKLTLAFTCILLILGLSVLWMSNRLSQHYFLEFTQQINAPIAKYMAKDGGFIKNNALNPEWLNELAPHVMMINPSVEVYMLDKNGAVVASSPDNTNLAVQRVSLQPIQRFLLKNRSLPIMGDDPKRADQQRVFSAFPLYLNKTDPPVEAIVGYVYAVVAGEKYQSVLGSLESSYSFKSLFVTLVAAMILALCGGVIVFLLLTRRLRMLTSEVSRSHDSLFNRIDLIEHNKHIGRKPDELEQLTHSYESMAKTLLIQYEELSKQDTNRREFIENISHDLRTPLTTIQSYLETLLLKDNVLSKTEKREYVNVAFRESKHLAKLVTQLFTLTRLESGEVQPAYEEFNLLELAHDAAQEFQLRCLSEDVKLCVQPISSLGTQFDVYADIAMIQRVFENLLGNAIRHTSQGTVTIRLEMSNCGEILVSVSDTGCGMTQKQCHKIQGRYYTGSDSVEVLGEHSGLGLAIVKNVLKLHKTILKVESELEKGTTFSFTLAPVHTNKHYDLISTGADKQLA